LAANPGVDFYADESPFGATREQVVGAPWSHDWRDIYPIAPDSIHNHTKPAYLGVLDGTESVSDWNPWEGVTHPHPSSVIRRGYGTPGIQEFAQAAPLAIDSFDRHPDHGQAQLSGISSIAALVPFIELQDYGQDIDPNSMAGLSTGQVYPYHFDVGGSPINQGATIGPRQIFRSPPSFSDQTAAFYAAGF
jgi:hypothetical protein